MPARSHLTPPEAMLTYVVGDIFRSPAAVLVNTVNTKGVMGKGLAKDFKALYPEMFQRYQKLCEEGKLDVGKLFLHRTSNKWVLNFPTKRDWRHPSKVEYIEAGLEKFVEGYARNNITSVAFPQLGCGHGELDWETEVQPVMEKYLSKVPIPVFIHLYRSDVFPKEHRDLAGTREWLHSEPESLGFHEVWEDIVTILRDQSQFTTIDTGQTVSVQLVPDGTETGLRFGGAQDFLVPKELLLDLWQHFRAVGFFVPENLPEGLATYAPQLMALLVKLPYVTVVDVARGRINFDRTFVKALQLVPRPAMSLGPVLELNARLAAHV